MYSIKTLSGTILSTFSSYDRASEMADQLSAPCKVEPLTAKDVHAMFTEINADNPDQYHDLLDYNYYADQIEAIYEIPWSQALLMAKQAAAIEYTFYSSEPHNSFTQLTSS